MLNTVLVVALGIVLFLCLLLGFYTGLRLGFRLSKGHEPPPLKSPVRIAKEAIERKETEKETKETGEAWESIMNFDGYTDEERSQLGGDA